MLFQLEGSHGAGAAERVEAWAGRFGGAQAGGRGGRRRADGGVGGVEAVQADQAPLVDVELALGVGKLALVGGVIEVLRAWRQWRWRRVEVRGGRGDQG